MQILLCDAEASVEHFEWDEDVLVEELLEGQARHDLHDAPQDVRAEPVKESLARLEGEWSGGDVLAELREGSVAKPIAVVLIGHFLLEDLIHRMVAEEAV